MERPVVKVLLVEDDEDDYILTRKLLSQVAAVRYDLQWAPTYGRALEMMGDAQHDVYVIDFQLGDHTGLELLREINGKGSTVPVIFLTGHGDYEVDMEAMRAGASDYLVKGRLSPALLERSIRYAIERSRLQQQLRQSHKLEALGTLAGGIAHDFNNILAAIIGFTELLQGDLAEGTRATRYANRVLEASIRGRELVKQLLAFSRKGEEERKPIFLSSIVEETVKLVRATTPSTISIRYAIRSESGPVLADPTQMQRVVMNLCTNAAYAMREKGGVLEIELADYSVPPSGNEDLNAGVYTRLTVSDTGTGIPPESMEKVFDPFFTTKKLGEGTGLGLSVVHGIVKQTGGAISVKSAVGRGATFTVCLPQLAQDVQMEASRREAIPTGTERILFVDDEEALVEVGKEILAELGYEVTSATSSTEALSLLEADPLRFDLLVTDQTMPDMTGSELAKKALSIRSDMPIIMCTGFSQLVDADKAKAEGIRAFAMKPLTKAELARTVRGVLDG